MKLCPYCGAASTERCTRCRDELTRELIVAIIVGGVLGFVVFCSFLAEWLS